MSTDRLLSLQDRAELLDFLLDLADVTASTLDLDELLEQVAGIISRVLPQDLLAIMLYSRASRGLRIRYSRGHREELVRSLLIRIGEGVTGRAAKTREPVVVPDVRNDPHYLSSIDAVRSEMAVPMTIRGRLVGVIDLQSTEVGIYNADHVTLARLIASRVAGAIDNARLHRRLEVQKQTLETLAALSREFSSTLDLETLFARMEGALGEVIPYDALGVYLIDESGKSLKRRFSVRQHGQPVEEIPLGQGITGSAALSRQIIRVPDVTADPRYIDVNPGIRSELAVPLMNKNRLLGVLDLESRQANRFNDDVVRLVSLIARELAISVENASLYEQLHQREQRMEQDLQAAQRVQSILLFRDAPPVAGLEIAIRARPARQISGDLYDFYIRQDGRAMIAFGDVSGKGAAAALYGALMSGLLLTLGPLEQSPAALLRTLNDTLLQRKVDAQYVTLSIIFWDVRTRTFTIANAGALPPVIVRRGERIPLVVEGVPIGLLGGQTYDEVCVEAEPGDALLLFSDGVADQEDGSGRSYGDERLLRVFSSHFHEPASQIVETVFSDLEGYMQSMPIQDDQTLISIKVA